MAAPNHQRGTEAGPSNYAQAAGAASEEAEARVWPENRAHKFFLDPYSSSLHVARLQRCIPSSHLTTSVPDATHVLLDPSLSTNSDLAREHKNRGIPFVSFEWGLQSWVRGRSEPVEEYAVGRVEGEVEVGVDALQEAGDAEAGGEDRVEIPPVGGNRGEAERDLSEGLQAAERPPSDPNEPEEDRQDQVDASVQQPRPAKRSRESTPESEEERLRRLKGKGRAVEQEDVDGIGEGGSGGMGVDVEHLVERTQGGDGSGDTESGVPGSPPSPPSRAQGPSSSSSTKSQNPFARVLDKGKGRERRETPAAEEVVAPPESRILQLVRSIQNEPVAENQRERSVPSSRRVSSRIRSEPSRAAVEEDQDDDDDGDEDEDEADMPPPGRRLSSQQAQALVVDTAIASARRRLEEKIAVSGLEAKIWISREPSVEERLWGQENPRNDALAVVDTDEIYTLPNAPVYRSSDCRFGKGGKSWTRGDDQVLVHFWARGRVLPTGSISTDEVNIIERMVHLALPNRTQGAVAARIGKFTGDGKQGHWLRDASAIYARLNHSLRPLLNPLIKSGTPLSQSETDSLADLFVSDLKFDTIEAFVQEALWLLNNTRTYTQISDRWRVQLNARLHPNGKGRKTQRRSSTLSEPPSSSGGSDRSRDGSRDAEGSSTKRRVG